MRSEFRTRLVKGGGEQLLFEALLHSAKDRGWLKAGGRQRTASTHVLGAIETLSRLEWVAETLRHALNILSPVVPEWVQKWVPREGYERDATRWQDDRLASGREEREELAAMRGADGRCLLNFLSAADPPTWIRELLAVQTLRGVWLEQFDAEESSARWREAKDLPPSSLLICTPSDEQARAGQKRGMTWTGDIGPSHGKL